MNDMNLADIRGEAVEHVLTYTGGTTRRVYVTQIETPYPHGKLIVSRTDTQGLFQNAWDATAFDKKKGEGQWEALGRVVRERDPKRIGLNEGEGQCQQHFSATVRISLENGGHDLYAHAGLPNSPARSISWQSIQAPAGHALTMP